MMTKSKIKEGKRGENLLERRRRGTAQKRSAPYLGLAEPSKRSSRPTLPDISDMYMEALAEEARRKRKRKETIRESERS